LMLKALPLTAELTQSPVLSTTISTGSVFPCLLFSALKLRAGIGAHGTKLLDNRSPATEQRRESYATGQSIGAGIGMGTLGNTQS
jgi:hypothetical protein